MKHGGRSSIPTALFSHRYIKKTWETRLTLDKYERGGFAQAFYLCLSAHCESVIRHAIARHLNLCRHLMKLDTVAPIFAKDANGKTEEQSTQPFIATISKLIAFAEGEAEAAQLFKLIEVYNRTFELKLKEVVEDDVYEDINCLASLRNVFAHGQLLVMDFLLNENNEEREVTLDNNPLKRAANRLHKVGLFDLRALTAQNYTELQDALFDDGTLLHFHSAARKFQSRIQAANPLIPALAWVKHPELPSLSA